ncbi:MAG TPA: alpha-amylase/4-alpha-glucanotransferase domain-containing protein [Candidatus Polarisedimenticolia bacterium]|nr:alpha-amylase/4-alpha-glucanotransferase domain-containing protein [Candidatus Polarisedimenticolia bacterium]
MTARLVLALHFHQPVGNFDAVFEDAVRLCYRPLVEHFERHRGVRAAFHLSGCLIEWLEGHDGAFLDRVVALVGSGQVEPMGGGFYEPILPVIPRVDALDQIDRLAGWWARRCGVRPAGAWVAERVWEPALAEILAEAGVVYTILDDQHLRFAGLLDDRFDGLFVTERCGRPVAFLPSDFRLRYLIPFRPVGTVREHFEHLPGDRDWVLTYGDDAEKFGLWPKTHRWVYEEGWLESFFCLLEEDKGPVRAVTPGDFLAGRPPARKVYVPNASYTEMLEWALPSGSAAAYAATREAALKGAPAESVRAFVRGSLWDMFLARYPEADHLHKHALRTSRLARALPAGIDGREAAITAALRAQCNCAYWHGLFGGVYYSHLRHGVYDSLLQADALLGRPLRGSVAVESVDLDGDLEAEVILRSADTQAFLRPSDGGTLVELDYLPARFNVTNVVSRWKEGYHEGADVTHAQEAAGSIASPHERAVDLGRTDLEGRHFDDLPLRGLRDFRCAEIFGSDALSRFAGLERLSGRLEHWETTGEGFAGTARLGPLRYRKIVTMRPSGELSAAWEIDPATAGAEGWFGTVLCLSLLSRDAPDRAILVADERGGRERAAPGAALALSGVTRVTLEDRAFGFALDITCRRPARLVTAPIETLQRNEDRYEAAYQGSLVAFGWPLAVSGGGGAGLELLLSFRRLQRGEGER